MNPQTHLAIALKKRGVRYFTAAEVLTLGSSNLPGGRAEGLNYVVADPYLLDRLADAAELADRIRRQFGSPITILSGFRSPEYNKAVGGASSSFHLRGMALDLSPENGDVDKLYSIANRMNDQGGVGRYPWGVHIDTREGRARW